MHTIINKMRNWGIGTKLALAIFLLVGGLYTCFTLAIGYSNTRLMESQTIEGVKTQSKMVVDMIEIVDSTTRNEASRSAKILKDYFYGEFTIDTANMVDVGGTQAPTLANGGTPLNLSYSVVDSFLKQAGATAAIFVKSSEDFIQISTSVKKEDGQRAVGSVLDHNHPAYKRLIAGESYTGPTTLFGHRFMTQYDPIKDPAGKVIGILYVGVDITDVLNTLKNKIKGIKIGQTGYFYALNAQCNRVRMWLF